MSTWCFDEAALVTYPISRTVGREAEEVQRREVDVERERFAAPGSGASFRAAVNTLRLAIAERRTADWDGHGSMPANTSSVIHAIGLLRQLLSLEPEPEVSIDPDGEVSLEWHRAPRLVFSVSVGPQGDLTYAGLFGRNMVHGQEAHGFHGVPDAIRSGIQRVYA